MSALERRYRLLLRAFPDLYRNRVGDELVASLLAAAGSARTRPPLREAVALVAAGLRLRLADIQDLSSATGRRWAGVVAVAMLAYITALVVGVHVPGEWAEPLPKMFLPAWAAITIVPIVAAVLPAARMTRRVAAFAGLAALLAGPSATMVSRTMLLAAGCFVVIMITAPRLKPLPVLIAAAAGVTVGLVAADQVSFVLPPSGDRLPHLAWFVTTAVTWEADVFSILCISAMVLFVLVSFVRPTIAEVLEDTRLIKCELVLVARGEGLLADTELLRRLEGDDVVIVAADVRPLDLGAGPHPDQRVHPERVVVGLDLDDRVVLVAVRRFAQVDDGELVPCARCDRCRRPCRHRRSWRRRIGSRHRTSDGSGAHPAVAATRTPHTAVRRPVAADPVAVHLIGQ